MKKHICLIHTGGTIGMVKSSQGYLPKEGYFETVLETISDLKSPEMPEISFFEMSPLLDSSDMAVDDWNRIGEEIAKRYDRFDGFVILHGTDTMAYTAAALSFMLEGLNKPVILTGSQIPLCEIRSDGQDNLVTSLLIASSGKINEVCLYFGGMLMTVKDGTARMENGALAGSTTSLFGCVKKAISFGISPEDAVKMASENPARMMGLNKGKIEVGYDADFIIVDGDFNLIKAIARGEF